ncbi:cob(I)yrinic acid a,c-diamide adenosyltransferase [Halorhodospira halophila]|uniref:Corrinoid adenosyltransferase n=1 Tax=Halorhodospira halophila (strain DSM 244 / SL1) TaxID=349124 RepID=A1WYB0_HALHL|nr:cob(I)yrinic acid a,c-diamide adenosyltransferase [Halorhodospira halophila]ABM62672.1 cob(I)yrinic acid a,c-diamide adenosyltransferase [Halorhodospira halophila SL1]MBK1728353.1 cob(I)yrinic acid a,c-diamide adenosyltransferase [Halorhodospira halophila]
MREDAKDPQRHAARMERKRAVMEERRSRAQQDRGVLLVLTGSGKGKSSSALGMVARTLGHGRTAGVMQFIKGRQATGEEAFFRDQPGVDWQVMGEGFTWETADRERDVAAAQAAWRAARGWLCEQGPSLVVLDELCTVLRYEYLELGEVLDDLSRRPYGQHVVVTGRYAPQPLIDAADTVSEIASARHAFEAGVRAQPGIEW